ncbi:hypothetical protein [Streptomyces clavifer]|uniref:hypothetical protein n=1 Tax=Streptomyces clavifer TaxID=68188 RepID=UPI00364921DA
MAVQVSRSDRLERLRAQLRGEPVSPKRAGQIPSSRGVNLLLGVLLHGAARLNAGIEPTDWEMRLLGSLRELLSDEEVRDFGRVYQEEEASRAKVLPDTFIGRPLEEGYTLQDVFAQLPGLHEEISAQPNVRLLDLDSPDGGTEDSDAFLRARADYGFGATVVTASGQDAEAQSAGPVAVKVWLDRFHMQSGSSEIGSEEIYWATAAGADGGTRQSTRSRVYTGMWSGNTQKIDPNTVVYHGAVDKVLTYHMQCWEEDHGAPSDLIRVMEDISNKAWEAAQAMGDFPGGTHLETTQAFIGFTAGIARLIAMLLDFVYDDLVDEHTVTVDRPALNSLAGRPHGEREWKFRGVPGVDGNQLLYVRTSVGKLPTLALRTFTGTTWTTLPQPPGTTPSAPALASYDGKLYLAVQGFDRGLYVSTLNGSSWAAFQKVPGHAILSAPALAVHGGRLYLATRGLANHVWVTSCTPGQPWSAAVRLHGATQDGPTLAPVGGNLYCLYRGVDNDKIYSSVLRNGTWGDGPGISPHPTWRSYYAPALARTGSLTQAAVVAANGSVHIISESAGSWTNAVGIGGTTAAAPALSEGVGSTACAVLGTDGNIWRNARNIGWGGSWSGFAPIPGASNAVSAPALAFHNGAEYLAYATTT